MNRIAVITRTKNRPLLLSRCLDSLVKQTYKDFIWVIVNDNGSVEEVDAIAGRAIELGICVQVIHRTESTGVAAAANNGIVSSTSEFIHIHDDDDTLEATFYQEAINFLDNKVHYSGVITSTMRIDEKVESNRITEYRRYVFCEFDSTLYIADLIWKNQFTTISFVYRRDVLKKIGMYDEFLPVVEDWDFNLRFIQSYDIGVIPKFLANYHWRVGTKTGGLTQTVTSGLNLHKEYTAVMRNKLLRQDMASGKIGLGTLITLGRYHYLQHSTLSLINNKLDALLWLRRLVKKIVGFLHFPRGDH